MFAQGNHPLSRAPLGGSNRTIEPAQTQKYTPTPGAAGLDALNTNDSSFFDFEPPSGTQSPYQNQYSTPGSSGLSWLQDNSFQPLSPPDSASLPPKEWPYDNTFQPQPSNILTNIDPANARTQYGQVTPPDDQNDSETLLEEYEQRRTQQPEESGRKRKRTSTNETETSSPPKRTRKYASRGNNKHGEQGKPEDAKRSKFLERNRVAASKCRQKKKEWTQNLETRARDLQKQNHSIRLMIESLRQEALFLKGEALKHHGCACHRIQEYIKSGSLANIQSVGALKQEHSPIGTAPNSPVGSVSAASRQSHDFDARSPQVEHTDDSMLEALLTSSINHDTSDEGIASQVAR